MFIEKQEQRNLSEYTLRDYHNVISLFVGEYAEVRISMIKPMDCKKFVQEKVSPNNQKHRQSHLKAFFEFSCGKNNPYCEEEAWLGKHPVNWELPKIEANEITCLTYDDIGELLRLSSKRVS
jgi:site-specific recombinase XerD